MIITSQKKPTIKVGFFVAIVVAVLLVVHFIGISRLTPEGIRNVILAAGGWGPIVYILLYTIRPLLLFPARCFCRWAKKGLNRQQGLVYGVRRLWKKLPWTGHQREIRRGLCNRNHQWHPSRNRTNLRLRGGGVLLAGVMGWCADVLMCWCADVLMCWFADVLMC